MSEAPRTRLAILPSTSHRGYGSTTLYEATPTGFQRSIDATGVLQVLTPFASFPE